MLLAAAMEWAYPINTRTATNLSQQTPHGHSAWSREKTKCLGADGSRHEHLALTAPVIGWRSLAALGLLELSPQSLDLGTLRLHCGALPPVLQSPTRL
jgi:hypothetical protein